MKSLLIALLLLLALAVPASARVFWDDDFENHLSPNWDTSGCPPAGQQDGCNPTISTDRAHSGTHSLKAVYTNSNTSGLGASGHYYNRFFNGGPTASSGPPVHTTDVYWRTWYYQDGPFSYAQTKHWVVGDARPGVMPSFWFNHESSPSDAVLYGQIVPEPNCAALGGTGAGNYDDCVYHPSSGRTPTPNAWVCLEGRLKMNTPGVNDGIAQLWQDGVPTLNVTTATFVGPNLTNPRNNRSDATWGGMLIYVQFGLGTIYYDDFAWGDTRIGCGGIVTPPSIPNAPSSLNMTQWLYRIWAWLMPSFAYAMGK